MIVLEDDVFPDAAVGVLPEVPETVPALAKKQRNQLEGLKEKGVHPFGHGIIK